MNAIVLAAAALLWMRQPGEACDDFRARAYAPTAWAIHWCEKRGRPGDCRRMSTPKRVAAYWVKREHGCGPDLALPPSDLIFSSGFEEGLEEWAADASSRP